MSNRKFNLSKISALVATSAALLAGAVSINSNEVKADSTPVLRFTHNAYKYNSKGKRISKKVIKKGARYFYTKKAKIHGKNYYKLDTKGNVYVKKGNVSVYTLSKTVELTHNAYQYNSKGKRIKSLPTLKKGDSYFVLGTKYINGKKFYRVDNNAYIKASNTVAHNVTSSNSSDDTATVVNVNDFNQSQANTNTVTTSQVAQNQTQSSSSAANIQTSSDASNTNNSGSNSHPTNNTNSSSANTQTNSNVANTNNSGSNSNTANKTNQQSANSAKTNTSANTSSTNSSKTNTNVNTNSGSSTSSGSNSSQKQSNLSSSTSGQNTTDNTPRTLNRINFPTGYLQAIKNSNFTVTPEIKKMVEESSPLNRFHSESVDDDNLKIDSDNMTPAQLQEINLFALRLINQARREMGTQQEWVYTERAQSIASRVAWLYEKHGKGISTWHDQDALNQVDREAGVHTAELLGGSSVTYHEDSLTTMTDLKRAVYNDIVQMLFNNQELEHAKIMTTWTSQDNPNQTSFALDVSWMKKNRYGLGEHSEHFIAY